ncbi:MAG: hypothetical protein EU532_04755 [Promethearchaeota archaeon]|nr:MAG: hypothetical protein EU532_04755 [Candidatus Lokiarchaeota archaeon]
MDQAEDTKLKTLIKLCKETQNYKTIAIVSFMLISNIIDEIGVKMGIRARRKESDETIFSYMDIVNSILRDNFKITLFKDAMIQEIREIEVIFIKMRGDIPLEMIIKAYDIYYDLRMLEIPNLYKKVNADILSENNDVRIYSLFSGSIDQQNPDKLKDYLLHNLKTKQLEIRKQLKNKYNKDLFKEAIYLKQTRDSLKNEKDGKILLRGRLKENLVYQKSMEDIYGYFILGIFFLFLILGFVITYECVLYPSLTASVSYLFLLTYGSSISFFLLYWYYYKKGETRT